MKTVQMSSVFCVGCHMPHSVDEDKLCEFCRRVDDRREERDNDGQVVLFVLLIIAVLALIGWFLSRF